MNRIYSLLALLLVGSASLQAQGGDPFGEFNSWLYQNNMTVTAQVVLNGTVVTEAIVAAYCGNELRGKNFVGNDPTHPNLIYLQVYANSTGTLDQFLHFKVFTNGHVFTFNPDPIMVFKNNDQHGKTSSPYIIDITPVSLPNDSDNASRLTRFVDKTCDIILTGRVLYKDGAWNTLYVPFATEIARSDLAGAIVRQLTAASIEGTTLYLTFGDPVTTLAAGTPYIIKWDEDKENPTISDPMFFGVTIDTEDHSYDNGENGDGNVRFLGTYKNTRFEDTDKSILYVGGENTLYYPLAGASIGAQRAYFKIGEDGAAAPARITSFNIDFGAEEAQGITTPLSPARGAGGEAWFTLDGRRLNGKPTQSGVYVNNGRKLKVVVK